MSEALYISPEIVRCAQYLALLVQRGLLQTVPRLIFSLLHRRSQSFEGCLFFLLVAPGHVYLVLEPGLHARLAGLLVDRDRQYRDIELFCDPYENRLGDDFRKAGKREEVQDRVETVAREVDRGGDVDLAVTTDLVA